MGGGMGKCSKIRHIVRLRQMLRRWRLRATASSRAAADVPAGHVAVCVGSTSRRFVVRASHLNHPVFKRLLRQAEEEYGFSSGRPGPLSLPCDEALFEHALRLISSSSSSSSAAAASSCFANCNNLDEYLALLYPATAAAAAATPSSCCCDAGRWMASADALPLLHSHRLAEKRPFW
ncbi:auxin-responsive protein SAUR36-like [Curcuma longa]|uniref:auxin-responsive protein SAUR36-like n=1 Tax=Curcuma longa TaxID=136217 RepID=UPI003D9E0A3E